MTAAQLTGIELDRATWLLEGVTSGGPGILAAAGIVFFGAACAWLVGVRGWLLTTVAALPIGIALLMLAAEITGLLGIEASLGLHAVAAIALAVALGAVGRLGTRGHAHRRSADRGSHHPHRLAWAGAAVGALVALGVWLAGIGDFRLPPQANDDIWHGYLVERLTHMPLVTATTVAPTSVDRAEPVAFYQYGLHLAAALGHEVTGVSIPEVLNGIWTVHVGMLLPFGLAALAWVLFPGRPWVTFWAGAIAPGVTLFPYLVNGILPYTVALAMTPGLLALTYAYLDRAPGVPAVAVALVAMAIFVTHPVAALVAGALAALLVAERAVRHRARPDLLDAARRLGGLTLLALVASLPWLSPAAGRTLGDPVAGAVAESVDAIWTTLQLGSPWTPAQPVLAALVALGGAAAVAGRRGVALALAALLFGALSVGVVAGAAWAVQVTGPWHANWYRLLAVVGLLVPLLAALGTATAAGWGRRIVERVAPGNHWAPTAAAVGIGLLAAAAAAYGAGQGQSVARGAWHSPGLVTSEDVALFALVSDEVGADGRVLNSPRDGSTWMYPLENVAPVLPYVYNRPLSLVELLSGSAPYDDPSAACRRLRQTGATHALVKEVRGDTAFEDYDVGGFVRRFPELFIEVVGGGSGTLYRIDSRALERCVDA